MHCDVSWHVLAFLDTNIPPMTVILPKAQHFLAKKAPTQINERYYKANNADYTILMSIDSQNLRINTSSKILQVIDSLLLHLNSMP